MSSFPKPLKVAAALRVFRPARLDELREIVEVNIRSWQATYRDLLPAVFLDGLSLTVERRVTYLSHALREGRVQIWVALLDGVIVGWSSFGATRDADDQPGTGELWALYLLEEVWSLGIGRELWRVSRAQLYASGFSSVTVWVLKGNLRAMAFYQAAGFVAEPHSEKVVEEGGAVLPLLRYRVALQAQ
jgi:ribosomal protein S18 acetylase RimI-like enzyme